MSPAQLDDFAQRLADAFAEADDGTPGSVDEFQRAEDEALARWFLRVVAKLGYAVVPADAPRVLQ